MTIYLKLASAIRGLLDRAESLTRSRTLRLLRRLEPAFVVFTVLGIVVASVAILLELSGSTGGVNQPSLTDPFSSTAPGNTGKANALKYLADDFPELRSMHLASRQFRRRTHSGLPSIVSLFHWS